MAVGCDGAFSTTNTSKSVSVWHLRLSSVRLKGAGRSLVQMTTVSPADGRRSIDSVRLTDSWLSPSPVTGTVTSLDSCTSQIEIECGMPLSRYKHQSEL